MHTSQIITILTVPKNLFLKQKRSVKSIIWRYVFSKHIAATSLLYALQDLSKLNRDPSRIIYISGHALESCLQPENAVPIKPWKMDDNLDTELLDLLPFLECKVIWSSVISIYFFICLLFFNGCRFQPLLTSTGYLPMLTQMKNTFSILSLNSWIANLVHLVLLSLLFPVLLL